jgi:DNA-binding MarR family transcriptional regulator
MHIDPDGTTVSTLAKRAKISPTAIGAIVDELDHLRYVSRRIDENGRRLVMPTTRGCALMALLRDFDRQMERELQDRLGTESYRALREGLHRLAAALPVGDMSTE